MSVKHLNPDGLHRSPFFSQAVAVDSGSRLLFIGGQNGVDASGAVVAGGLGEQTRQIFRNLRVILAEAGGELHHIIKWTIVSVEGTDPGPALAVFGEEWGSENPPPAISVMFVADVGPPGAIVEIEAVAAIPV